MSNFVSNSDVGLPMPPWPQAPTVSYLPQPPFMPPSVVGKLNSGWFPPPPPVMPKPSYSECESFPYNPNSQSFAWRQFNNSNNRMGSSQPAPYDCESFPYNSNSQSFRWRQKENYNHTSSNYDENYIPRNKKNKIKEEYFIDFCDVCDRGFKTEEKKRQHYSEHRKCSEPGCNFEAHFKIVEIHKRNLHGNGYRLQLSTPEEIKKWREERRKNFPTEKRIKEKQLEIDEKRKSGAVIETQSFGKFGQSRGRGRGRGRGRFFNRRGKFSHRNHRYERQEETELNEKDSSKDIVRRNTDDSNINKNSNESEAQQCQTGNLASLSQLISNYQSDESGDEIAANKGAADVEVSQMNNDKEICAKNESFRKNTRYNNCRQNRGIKRKNYQTALTRPSLLRMLLEPEIRRERNDIMQCVRYIVDNDFFEVREIS